MPWRKLLEQRRVVLEKAYRAEIEAQRELAARALADASIVVVSNDGRFNHAYDAARALATLVVRASGYRVKGAGGGHYNTFLALEAADPESFAEFAAYFDLCRAKRNELSYISPGIVSRSEVDEILDEVPRFMEAVHQWLLKEHPDLT